MTTRDPIPPNGDEQLRRQQMLETLAIAVQDEDLEFFSDITSQQTSLRPFELAEYLDVKRRYTEDPVESRRWEDGLRAYLLQLEGQEFPPEEAEVISSILLALNYEASADSVDTSEPADGLGQVAIDEVIERTSDDESDDTWDEDEFKFYMDNERHKWIIELPVYKEAARLAAGNSNVAANLESAIAHIEDVVEGQLAEDMRKIIDYYVFTEAQKKAAGNSNVRPNLEWAHNIVEDFGSDEDAIDRMKSALDKYVYKVAEKLAKGNSNLAADLPAAKETVEDYASSPARRDAMLRHLGFI